MADLAGKTVLCADDDLEILGLVTRHVKSLGATVLEASDGEEALRVARREKPDLIVLDVMMPGMSGWEVCRAVREDENLADTGVLMLTGIGERLNEMTSPLYGADDFLDKPFDLEDLEAKLEDVLAKRAGG
ncbi:MAG TPA: response regulator [Polyangiaceae bacterium LLY-WYZ-15_(1-7)]|nr:response regulator [Polyangiaceae bacterium LLY-WYZ-15_(1-7)]HJL02597.1 response regulator [Polyangiaceae bacterium LLY-WYZ-15_(1-7)]HJL11267.1 response regulator [Polyangiaceae bacterium LLY-WYZ-15_(1-7)]HJL24801.1 response regulator [Polyangiaceae bacterium LLY-WYZ-15_(1-7)]HJL28184.1 response regulator [Polyangiaceae bacterium LLY-WYZ-15_(1-7)]